MLCFVSCSRLTCSRGHHFSSDVDTTCNDCDFVRIIQDTVDEAAMENLRADFRTLKTAFEYVGKNKKGFTTYGWDTGDLNGNHIRDFFDEGDFNKNGNREPGEVWTGVKVYSEEWTGVYSLVNPSDENDKSAFKALEHDINEKLSESLLETLQIEIIPEIEGYKMNGNAKIRFEDGKDYWDNSYHGYFLAGSSDRDVGTIIIYTYGPNCIPNGTYSAHDGVSTICDVNDDFYIALMCTFEGYLFEINEEHNIPYFES
jgi:hypothetical protein